MARMSPPDGLVSDDAIVVEDSPIVGSHEPAAEPLPKMKPISE